MEKVEYREATFDVIRTLSCERTRVKDTANNYLYTHWEFTIEVNWHPAMVAYKRGATAGAPPVEDPGGLPGETDLALLNRLLQPRGLLRVTAGDSVILETPAISGQGRMPCDVKGGPSCEMVGVPSMIGVRHWFVVLRFTADVRDLDESRVPNQNAILSNLWVSTEDVDESHRSVRHFAGRAIMRADVMRQAGINANSFRDLYLFKCPPHYQRTNVSAKLSEDGTVLEWSFTDVMQGYDKGFNSPILHIECFRTGFIRSGGPAHIVAAAARSALGTGISSPLSTGMGASAFPAALIAAQLDNIPTAYMQVRCDLIGDRNADLGRLTSIALGVCVNQLMIEGINTASAGLTEMVYRQDIADAVYTSVEMTQKWTEDAALLGNILERFGRRDLVDAFQPGAPSVKKLAAVFRTDSRVLTVPDNAEFADARRYLNNSDVVASRDQNVGNKGNPAMTQGAFGVNIDTPPPAGRDLGIVVGSIPNGIEKLIVQALLGIGVAPPPVPPSLVRES